VNGIALVLSDLDALVLDQAVENFPSEGPVRAAALSGELVDLISTLLVGACRGFVDGHHDAAVHPVCSLSGRQGAKRRRLSFTKKCMERN
jgi:hypothetical protein